jgi:hypothetical protein
MAKISWADDARGDQWWQEREPQQVIGIVEALVDGDGDASSAVRQVTSLYEPLVKQDSTAVTVIWGILFRAIRSIGQDEVAAKKLRDFVLGIQEVDDVLTGSGAPVKLNGQVVWRGLPEFSYMFREYCICKPQCIYRND